MRPDRVVCKNQLDRMKRVLWHRGPDEGHSVVLGPVGLAHRRLSIIDLGNGVQPMADERKRYWITYNGEIYNYRELRAQLQADGATFRTHSDTEVVLKAYERYGEHCVEHLRGMFAFAIWDTEQEKLMLARDRLGIKPLYYATRDETLIFASEIKGLLASGMVTSEMDASAIPEYLASRYVSDDSTFFKGVRKLLPGRVLTWSRRCGTSEHCYWRVPYMATSSLSFAEHADMVREKLKDAVRSHMVSDVPVGLFLSGGIDSSALAALMSEVSDEPIKTFSVGFGERSANELEYARLAAKDVGSDHHDLTLSPDEYLALLPQLVYQEDEPIAFTSSVPLYAVSRLAKQHVKVVLTGEGADETFLGYNKYRVSAWNHRLGQLYSAMTPAAMRRMVAAGVPALPGKLGRYGSRTFLAREMEERDYIYENFSVFPGALRQEIFADASLAEADPFGANLARFALPNSSPLRKLAFTDLQTYLVELLMKQDQMSMAASLESRVPFLDHELVESVMAIPDKHKIRGWQTKAVLRKALQDVVPKPILTRKKMGFPVPVSEWFRGRFTHVVDEVILGPRARARGLFRPEVVSRLASEHRRGIADHGERLWLLLNLEIWQRIFVDGEEPQDINLVPRPVKVVPLPIQRYTPVAA